MGETESSKRSAARPVKNVSNQAEGDSRARPKKDTRAETGSDEVEAMSHKLGLLKVRKSAYSRIVAGRSQEPTMETAAISSSSDEEDEGEDVDEQDEINTTLSAEDTALFAELMQVIKKGGELKKLRVDHLKAYLRHYGLRISGLKDILVSRIEQHLKIKDGQGEAMYPTSSFTINCKGDVCLGDTVLFAQAVYDTYDIVKRSSGQVPLGLRTVAGKVVNESYGAGKQQHTFTIEVLWSKGLEPFYAMRPLQIKGRNLYRMTTLRQKWDNEEDRKKVLAEKHARGEEARAKRRAAKELRESSRSKPRSRAQSKTRHEGGSSRSIAAPSVPSRRIPVRGSYTQSTTASLQAGQYRDEQGILHMTCSTSGCDKAGAKYCITQSCAPCCSKNERSCPRHP